MKKNIIGNDMQRPENFGKKKHEIRNRKEKILAETAALKYVKALTGMWPASTGRQRKQGW